MFFESENLVLCQKKECVIARSAATRQSRAYDASGRRLPRPLQGLAMTGFIFFVDRVLAMRDTGCGILDAGYGNGVRDQ